MELANVLNHLAQLAPLHLAASWDRVGLLVGDPDRVAHRVMTCLDVTDDTAAEAVDRQADLVVTHHPVLFEPARTLVASDPGSRRLLALIRADVAVYSAHTAYDSAQGGINDQLAGLLELHQVRPLEAAPGPTQYKLVVFVPEPDLPRVQQALFDAGAGVIGQYRECSYRVEGTGTFFGTDSTHPAVGVRGRREQVSELRLEVVCSSDALRAAVDAMRRAHSYEEPAYEVYPLEPVSTDVGTGRVGDLAEPRPLADVANRLQHELSAPTVRLADAGRKHVQRVGVGCGAGGSLIASAVDAGCELFVTGEARHHDLLAARSQGVAVVLVGHYHSERFAMVTLAERLADLTGLEVWASRRESPPDGAIASVGRNVD